jgi:hypothetical protein
MNVVYYYVLIKLPGWEIGAVLALHQPLVRAGGRAGSVHIGGPPFRPYWGKAPTAIFARSPPMACVA